MSGIQNTSNQIRLSEMNLYLVRLPETSLPISLCYSMALVLKARRVVVEELFLKCNYNA